MSKCSVLGVKIAWQSINLRVVGRYSWIPFSLRNVLEKNFTVNKFKNVTDVLKNLLLKIDIWEFWSEPLNDFFEYRNYEFFEKKYENGNQLILIHSCIQKIGDFCKKNTKLANFLFERLDW